MSAKRQSGNHADKPARTVPHGVAALHTMHPTPFCRCVAVRTKKNSPGCCLGLFWVLSADFAIGDLRQLRLLEQGQHALLRLVGLGQHGGGGLGNDLRLGQVGRLFGVVGVHDAAA